jgi:hypothetical protein
LFLQEQIKVIIIMCSASSSHAGIKVRWAGLTLFAPFRTYFVSVERE